MSSLDFQKWRHDLRSIITQIDQVVALLTTRDPDDADLDALVVAALRKSQRKLNAHYDGVIELEDQIKAQGSMSR